MNILEDLFFDMLAWGNLILIPLCLLPLYFNLKYYKKSGIIDYFLIALFFFGWSFFQGWEYFYSGFSVSSFSWSGIVHQFDIIDLIWGKFLYFIWMTLDAIPLFIVAIRAKYGNSLKIIPNFVKGISAFTIFLTITLLIDQNQTIFNPEIFGSDYLRAVLFLNRLLFHLFIVYAFFTSQYIHTTRSGISRNIWIISSVFWVFGVVWAGSILLIFQINMNPLFIAIFIIPIDLGYLFLLINHIFYPESVLFTHEQVGRAIETYSRIQKASEATPDWGIKHIKAYLDSLPENIKKQTLS